MVSPEFLQASKKIVKQIRHSLNLDMGIVSHIHDDSYEVIAVDSSTGVFQPGETFALQDTFCREVYQSGKTIAMTEINGMPGLSEHPLYLPNWIEAYISTPIMQGNKIWGTLNFTSMAVRNQPFSAFEIEIVEDYANRLSQLLTEATSM